LINDDIALAGLVDADGVPLGQEDGNLLLARALLGPERLLGVSCYADFALAEAAVAAGADYVAFGAVYPSPTKPLAPRATVDLFSRAKSTLTVPACAIGGITLDNAPPLIEAGAALLAVITDLFSAPDSAVRAAAYQKLF
jgi:thiamine-phosphate pyrophosphorylase